MKVNFTRPEAAEYLGIKTQTLADWAYKGIGPKFSKFGYAKKSKVIYQKDDLDAFIQTWKVKTLEMGM